MNLGIHVLVMTTMTRQSMKTVAMLIMFRISGGTKKESTPLRISTVKANATRAMAVVLNLSASITDDDPVPSFKRFPYQVLIVTTIRVAL